jgi:hypothetical protein
MLALDELDDISKVLGLHLGILTAGYWFVMQAVYPVGSVIAFLLFGRACSEMA